MKQIIKYGTALLLLAMTMTANAQEITTEETKEKIIERIAESFSEELSEESDLVTVLEDLQKFAITPLDLNNASREQLEKLHFLSAFQIENLLSYRQKYGQILSVFELQAIDGFSAETAKNLNAFVAFQPLERKQREYLQNELNIRLQHPFQKSKAFLPNADSIVKYPGNPQKIYFKYQGEMGERFRWGLTGENDAGEHFFGGSNQYGFDFYSAHFAYHGKKHLKGLHIGDYQVKIGQGLTLWTGYGQRKSVESNTIRMSGQGLRPYTSTDENGYLRGAAANLEFGPVNVITFYSNKRVDGNIIAYDADSVPITISSLQTSGFHRTASEIDDKNSVQIQTSGSSARLRLNKFSAGLNGIYQQLSADFQPEDKPYNKHAFRGKENFNLSADALWIRHRTNFFGEAAFSKSGGKALLVGMEALPTNQLSFSILFRDYAANFHSIGGSAFAEGSSPINERGIYTGFTLYPFPKFQLSGYSDLYQSHWIKYTSVGPVRGVDTQLQLDYNLSRKVSMYVRFKAETNQEKSSETAILKEDETQTIQRLRYHLNYNYSQILELRFRGEISHFTKEDLNENGMLLMADAIVRLANKLNISTRLVYFNTDSYNARIYTYENDMPLSFYIPAYFTEGFRTYMNLTYKISRNIGIYLKYGHTIYLGTESIGSGDSMVQGNQKSEFKLQVRFKF